MITITLSDSLVYTHKYDINIIIRNPQKRGFRFLPVYLVSGMTTLPWRRCLSFLLRTQSRLLTLARTLSPRLSPLPLSRTLPTVILLLSSRSIPVSSPSPSNPFGSSAAPPTLRHRKHFFAFVLFGKSTTTPPLNPALVAASMMRLSCCGVSGYSWNTAFAPRVRAE